MEKRLGSLLITGVSGYVGRAVAALAVEAGRRVAGTYLAHPPQTVHCKLIRARIEEIPALIETLRPTVVLHTAAAWRTEEEAQRVIVKGTLGIARAAAASGARLIHMSTDLVFDGEHAPYDEASPPAPINFYGAAKAEAEAIVAAMVQDAVIVRTSLVTCFDPPDPRTAPIVEALRGRIAPVTLFTDEYRCPVRIEDLAAALVELIDLPYRGILHLVGPERLSRCELGLRIAAYHRLPPEGGIIPAHSIDSGLRRPRDCTLTSRFASSLFHTRLRPLP